MISFNKESWFTGKYINIRRDNIKLPVYYNISLAINMFLSKRRSFTLHAIGTSTIDSYYILED